MNKTSIEIIDDDVFLFAAVVKESERAFKKFGAQLTIPSVDPEFYTQGNFPKNERKEFYAISNEAHAKMLTESAMANGCLTWAHVAIEELAEVIGAKTDVEREVEIVQLMSVCHRWLKAIDYQNLQKAEDAQ